MTPDPPKPDTRTFPAWATINFAPDSDGRMLKAYSNPLDPVEYKYDALGRRISSKQPGQAAIGYTFDGDDVLLANNGGTITKYRNGPGIDNKLRSDTGSTPTFYMPDHLGTTIATAGTSGSFSVRPTSDSFGNGSSDFTGREPDSFTGLTYYRARMYDPQLGRFTSEDPIGFEGGDVNLYGYVRNGPLLAKDPRGLDILVIENGPTQGNPFGHTAIAITGQGLFSYGNGYDGDGSNIVGGSPGNYFIREVFRRNTTLWVIPTSPDQDQRALEHALDIDYYQSPLTRNGLFFDNCSLRSNKILDAAGIPNNNWFPDFLPGTAGTRAYDFGASPYFIPQDSIVRIIPGYVPNYDFGGFEPTILRRQR